MLRYGGCNCFVSEHSEMESNEALLNPKYHVSTYECNCDFDLAIWRIACESSNLNSSLHFPRFQCHNLRKGLLANFIILPFCLPLLKLFHLCDISYIPT